MNPSVGFVTVPRTELNRPAGAFFSAAVEARLGPGTWRVVLDGRPVTVSTNLELVPGQLLRMKLASQVGGRWIFQIVPRETPASSSADPALLAAFVSRGLPAAAERLTAWTRWLAKAGPSEKAEWAASLEARSSRPESPLTQALEPWLAWQASLERGDRRPPPEDDPWDLWNAHRPSGDPWLVLPLTWEYGEHRDSGLLQAHFNPAAQAVDRWNLTAAPAGVPFRLEAGAKTDRLDLVWRFFDEGDRRAWVRVAADWQRRLSTLDFAVTLTVEGPRGAAKWTGGVDVSV